MYGPLTNEALAGDAVPPFKREVVILQFGWVPAPNDTDRVDIRYLSPTLFDTAIDFVNRQKGIEPFCRVVSRRYIADSSVKENVSRKVL